MTKIKSNQSQPAPAPRKKTTQQKIAHLAKCSLLALTIAIITLSLLTYNPTDISFIFDSTDYAAPKNVLGSFGAYISSLLLYFFGFSSLLIPGILLYCLRTLHYELSWWREIDRIVGLCLFILIGAVASYEYDFELFRSIQPGGYFGLLIHYALSQCFTPTNLQYFIFTLSWATGIVVARFSFICYLYPLWDILQRIPFKHITQSLTSFLSSLVPGRIKELLGMKPKGSYKEQLAQTFDNHEQTHDSDDLSNPDMLSEESAQYIIPAKTLTQHSATFSATKTAHQTTPSLHNAPKSPLSSNKTEPNHGAAQNTAQNIDNENSVLNAHSSTTVNIAASTLDTSLSAGNGYTLPPHALFAVVKEQHAEMTADSQQSALTLEHKLDRFGIKGKVVSISQGPVVTLFEYQPSIDTKISTILAREDDLALALQALSLRIIAPIPGRSVIGFEVAHNKRRPVWFSSILRGSAFTNFKGSLPLILGKDTIGQDVVNDLATMPHLLVAGSTGSGKSVGLHTMVMSLLCSKSPDEIKLIMIDPKRLEFAAYADIAHLLFPIVTDPRRAIAVLKWAVETMEERYARMAQAGVRNCVEYNAKPKEQDEENLPFIVIVIDELADLMMTAGKEVEILIARLAQMARAAGIHMIAATQRPSVDVITGLIKVNFPSRIAYKVTSKVDSRTILDMVGAEKLLGKGDMLFSDTRAVHRVHGAYVTDAEMSAVVEHIKSLRAVEYKELTIVRTEEPGDGGDELFEEIIQYLKNKDEVSISLIQRVFRIGYNRSARIMDQLESYGYILPADGSKMRKVVKEQ